MKDAKNVKDEKYMKYEKYVEIRYLRSTEVEIRFLEGGWDGQTGRSIFLLGSAHVSEQSAKQTVEKIEELEPDCICVELDQKRYESLRESERWKNLDLFETLKSGKGFLLLVNLLLASFQRRVGKGLAVLPGQEMLCAVELAEKQNIRLELVDRPVEVTLKRAWAACSAWQRFKLLNGLLASLFENEEISESDIEKLKEANTLEYLMDEFADYLPSIKTSLIDERDVFLARSIANAPGKNVFAVLGAGHLRGVCLVLERILGENVRSVVLEDEPPPETSAEEPQSEEGQGAQANKNGAEQNAAEKPPRSEQKKSGKLPEWLASSALPSSEDLLLMPKKSMAARLLPWLLPALAVGIMLSGFFFSDTQKALHGLGVWVLSHSVLAGLAAILVLAHPVSILVAVLTSPFTALNPTVSVGLLTAMSEVLLRKPRVGDLENLLELEKWWQFRQNRIWHALAILFVVSLGGAAATFIALPWLSVLFSV